MVIQFGISLVVPVLACLFGCSYLCSHFGAGQWVYIPGFILGIGASAMTYYKVYIKYKNARKSKKKPVAFNSHE